MDCHLGRESCALMGGGYTPTATDIKAADAYLRVDPRPDAQNRPLNEFVAEQITATGSNLTNGPANLYTMLVHDVQVHAEELRGRFLAALHRRADPVRGVPQPSVRPLDDGRLLRLRQLLHRHQAQARGSKPREFTSTTTVRRAREASGR